MSAPSRSTVEPDDAVSLFRVLIVLGLRLRALMDKRLASSGLTTQQAAVLTIVETRPNPPRLRDIAATLGSSHQNARQLVDALVKKGLLQEQVDPDDGRAVRLVLTPAVRRLFVGRDAADHEAVRRWLGGLTARELPGVLAALRRLYEGLPSDEVAAPPPTTRRRGRRAR